MLFVHISASCGSIGYDCGARDEPLLAATAQNLRRRAKLIPAQMPIMVT
jgi:hypothetical protein